MSTPIERSILTVIEPTIVLDELKIPDLESKTENAEIGSAEIPLSKVYSVIPLIRINELDIQLDRLEMFVLNCSGFYPTCRFSFFDRDNFFTARHFPKDGDIIQVYIAADGDETTFKPIRIDFIVENVKPLGGGASTNSAGLFLIEGRMNVPNLFTETVEYYEDSSWNSLLNIAERLQLGFASNIDETSDAQVWINPYDSAEKFIQDITANSYLDDESFLTSYIDQYYYLNLVEVNKLFSQEGDAEQSIITYKNTGKFMGFEDKTDDDSVFPNMLTNIVQLQSTSRYISYFQHVNNSGKITKDNGYKRYVQYWDLNNSEFISEFIDPLTTNSEKFIPINKGRLSDENGPRDTQIKYKYLGTQGDNVHENYTYSAILNYQNLTEIDKNGMTVELDLINSAISRFSRIYCLIVEYSQPLKDTLTAPSNDENVPEGAQQRQGNYENGGNDKDDEAVINEHLSGYYVITGIEYFLTKPGALRQRLHLRRREAIPST
jgi:hypothetical protein